VAKAATKVSTVSSTGTAWGARGSDPAAAADLGNGLPFIDLHMAEAKEFALLVEQLYASDRDSVAKGVIEVVL